MRVFNGVDELKAAIGDELGVSEWLTIDQERINRFADATGDHQWIHVDAERAARGPFGKTIAHGFLTVSLIPLFNQQVFKVENIKMGINYGLNKVRFTSPVPVGSRLRARYEVLSVEDVGGGGVQVANKVTIELEGSERPACVAETLSRYYL
ncbi:MaoC family dehydratase [Pseudonocardia eucalypti]|uniref:MaoC family dehydratase n=1 Tax=Pseudonocardia eucalypti TaxID=648755 RepID=A0ABP9R029_9PSEU|nr:acyl dehydratase [Pseudonocardia eucalypti]